jgi:ATP-dependent Lon protease
LISGGQGTKATLFYNNARRRIGLIGFWDTVAFDEVAGIKIRDPDTIQIMKDYMANGRFSRGVEVIADASLAFVGNIDQSIEQLVTSTQHDLFQPLPPEFDLAVMDRFACYLPGWEMPKNSSEYLTASLGFITDYLAEAFHHQSTHSNRYEEVTKRIRLGPNVEGRDEKAIKKTTCALLKILHPDGPPGDAEFEEYVAYAVECRRRVKEQMNKRKPDDEFARINLSYFTAGGQEVIVYCPESRTADATQNPVRKGIKGVGKRPAAKVAAAVEAAPPPAPAEPAPPELRERHFTIHYGDTGHSYESIVAPYLRGAKSVLVEDPYIRVTHQINNLVRFCEAVVKLSAVKKIRLATSYEHSQQKSETEGKLEELKQSLLELDVVLEVEWNQALHDREIQIDNGWVIKIGRGLDFYQKPGGWFDIGANDLSLRKCLETKVDIFRKE